MGNHLGFPHELIALSDVLEIPGDDPRVLVNAQRLDQVQLIDIGFVADAGQLAEADAVGIGHVQNGRQQCPGLRQVSDGPDRGQVSAEARIDLVRRGNDPQAVRPDDSDPRGPGDLEDLLFKLAALLADLLEPSRDDNHGLGPNLRALSYHVRHELGRDDYNHEVGLFADSLKALETRNTLDVLCIRVHRPQLALVAGLLHIGQYLVAHLARLARCANNGYGLRTEKIFKTHSARRPFRKQYNPWKDNHTEKNTDCNSISLLRGAGCKAQNLKTKTKSHRSKPKAASFTTKTLRHRNPKTKHLCFPLRLHAFVVSPFRGLGVWLRFSRDVRQILGFGVLVLVSRFRASQVPAAADRCAG